MNLTINYCTIFWITIWVWVNGIQKYKSFVTTVERWKAYFIRMYYVIFYLANNTQYCWFEISWKHVVIAFLRKFRVLECLFLLLHWKYKNINSTYNCHLFSHLVLGFFKKLFYANFLFLWLHVRIILFFAIDTIYKYLFWAININMCMLNILRFFTCNWWHTY